MLSNENLLETKETELDEALDIDEIIDDCLCDEKDDAIDVENCEDKIEIDN